VLALDKKRMINSYEAAFFVTNFIRSLVCKKNWGIVEQLSWLTSSSTRLSL
jgi:hypothetical protein